MQCRCNCRDQPEVQSMPTVLTVALQDKSTMMEVNPLMSMPSTQQGYINLNVGGTFFTTSRDTLTRYQGSKLHSMFSKDGISTVPRDDMGRYMIDRDGSVFGIILNFLRSGNLNLATDFTAYGQLFDEANYFQLPEMKKRLISKTETLNVDLVHDVVENLDCGSNMELSNECEDPWFLKTNPDRSPYIPQMGDEIMYFWQGHKCYVEAVAAECIYDIEETKFPWDRGDLKTEEPMRVVDLEYHSGPTITCEIKLASIDPITKKRTGKTFRLRYHVMPRIKDFMVLLQHYRISLERKWKPGDKFRAVIDNKWWFGVIKEKRPMDKENPESRFQCFVISWRNGESYRLSPWELERNGSENSPINVVKEEQITEREMQELLYNSEPDDWDGSDQNTECSRILSCLDQIMSLDVTKKLISVANSSNDFDGDTEVPYPINLQTIRKRLERQFYRTQAALRWEVKQIESNANMFNEPNSEVVKSAELMTILLTQVIRNLKLEDTTELCNGMVGISDTKQKTKGNKKKRSRKVKKMSSSEEDSDDEIETQPSKRRRSTRTHDEKRWVTDCKNLLDKLFELEVSKYFQFPTNTSVFKDYLTVIKEPMDLTTVKKRWESGHYEDPHEFAKDIRLIVSNSKAYNTDKTKKIYIATREFSKFFEDNIRGALLDYKNAAAFKKLQPKRKGTPNCSKDQKAPEENSGDNLTDSGKLAGPSGIRTSSKAAQVPVSRCLSLTSQAKDGKVDSDCDNDFSPHTSSDEEYRQPSPRRDSCPYHEHDIN